jgi:hypothetical protein
MTERERTNIKTMINKILCKKLKIERKKSLKIPKGVIRSRIAQTIQWPKEKGQTIIYKQLYRKTKDRATRISLKLCWNSGAPEESAVPVILGVSIMLLYKHGAMMFNMENSISGWLNLHSNIPLQDK